MGFTTVTFCQTCGVVAPEVGDFGFAGLPSRATVRASVPRRRLLPMSGSGS
jgi:hypothetical protein